MDEVTAEEGVECVAVVVQQQAVLGLHVRHRVEPPLHRARAQRQRDLGHSPPVLELVRVRVRVRARVRVRGTVAVRVRVRVRLRVRGEGELACGVRSIVAHDLKLG